VALAVGLGSLVSDGLFSSGQCAGRWSTAGLGLDSSAPARLARGPGWSARGSRPRGYLDRVSDAQWRRQAINTDTSFQVTRTARQPVVNHSVYAMDDHGRFPKLADNFLQLLLLQPFNGLFSRTAWVSRYQKGKTNLDFTGARDSEWQ